MRYVFAGSLFFTLAGCGTSEQQKQSMASYETLVSQCTKSEARIAESLHGNTIFIDDRIFWQFLPPPTDNRNLGWRTASFDNFLDYFLANDFGAIETIVGFNTSMSHLGPERQGSVIKIYVAPEGTAECKNFYNQYIYKLQVLPGLRKHGIKPDQCIAMKYSANSEADLRIDVDEEVLATDFRSRVIKAKIRASRVSSEARIQAINSLDLTYHFRGAVGKYLQDSYMLPCDAVKSNLLRFRDSIRGSETGQRLRPKIVNLGSTGDTTQVRTGSKEDIDQYNAWTGWLQGLGANQIDPSGRVWFGGRYETGPTGAFTLAGPVLNYYSGDKIVVRPLWLPKGWDWATVRKVAIRRDGIHVSVTNRGGESAEEHLWIRLDRTLEVDRIIKFSGAELGYLPASRPLGRL